MITIEGIAKNSGIAIAVVAAVDIQNGINGVSPNLLQSGIQALRSGKMPQDYPEAIIVCDSLAMATAIKIPGINSIGIAAQSDQDIPGLSLDCPCVIGLTNLFESISEGDILILDGNEGVVHIDPDPETIIHYQQIEVNGKPQEKVFISSEHIPAKTQDGHIVKVYALAFNQFDVTKALDNGADGLIVDMRNSSLDTEDFHRKVLHEAIGKPVEFIEEEPINDIISGDGRLIIDLCDAVFNKADKAEWNDLLSRWVKPGAKEEIVFIIGDKVDALGMLIKAGAKSVAVLPNSVTSAKYAIRSIVLEDAV